LAALRVQKQCRGSNPELFSFLNSRLLLPLPVAVFLAEVNVTKFTAVGPFLRDELNGYRGELLARSERHRFTPNLRMEEA
jgi:hypothetical protein